jgi:molybdopterin molybdotransferase
LLLIGIPGNPVSSAVGFEFFLKPLLLGMLGAKTPPVRSLPLRESVEKPEGLRCFLRGKREEEGIRALPGQGSFMIHSLMEAEAWIELPEEGSRFPVGTRVRVHPLERDHSW